MSNDLSNFRAVLVRRRQQYDELIQSAEAEASHEADEARIVISTLSMVILDIDRLLADAQLRAAA